MCNLQQLRYHRRKLNFTSMHLRLPLRSNIVITLNKFLFDFFFPQVSFVMLFLYRTLLFKVHILKIFKIIHSICLKNCSGDMTFNGDEKTIIIVFLSSL